MYLHVDLYMQDRPNLQGIGGGGITGVITGVNDGIWGWGSRFWGFIITVGGRVGVTFSFGGGGCSSCFGVVGSGSWG